ncbi:MAG: helix-turn-helix domain-containing protein [Acidimicrobiia bacterium]|nr:helix-turn-helix domain-containing protein [Acidimicrobiia bacterium]
MLEDQPQRGLRPETLDLLTVEEACEILRIGRTKAYAMAKEWRTSGGTSGLPVVDLGNILRVPRSALEELVARQAHASAELPAEPASPREPGHGNPKRPRSTPKRVRHVDQLDLFDPPGPG